MYLSECSVLFVEFGHAIVRDEELTAVGIGAAIRHRNDPSSIVFDCINDLIFKRCSIYTFAYFSRARWVSSLNDEP